MITEHLTRVKAQAMAEIKKAREARVITLTLPYPHKNLSPNARKSWRVVASHKAKLRFDCKVLAKQHPTPPLNTDGVLVLRVKFCPPDKRRRDRDNAQAAFKSGFDGLADAWGMDDACFDIKDSWGDPVLHGAVVVEVGV